MQTLRGSHNMTRTSYHSNNASSRAKIRSGIWASGFQGQRSKLRSILASHFKQNSTRIFLLCNPTLFSTVVQVLSPPCFTQTRWVGDLILDTMGVCRCLWIPMAEHAGHPPRPAHLLVLTDPHRFRGATSDPAPGRIACHRAEAIL